MILRCMFFGQRGAKSMRLVNSLLLFLTFSSIPLLIGSEAKANPFFVGRFNGLLGGPLDESAFSLYWNPANLYTERIQFDLHVGIISRQASYDRFLPETVEADVAAANGGLSTTSALGALPSLAFHSGLSLNDDFKLGYGAGVYIARAGTANWDRDPEASSQYPGAYDGPQRWSALSTFMLLVNYAGGVSLEYDRVSIGAALSYVDTTLSTTKAANADKSDDLTNPDGELKEGRIFLDGATGANWNATLGINLDFDDIDLAYAWRLPVIYELQGTAYVLYANAPETRANAQVELQVAESHLISLAYTEGKIRYRFEYERLLWSIMDQQQILNVDQLDANGNPRELLLLDRQFKDTNAYRFRLDYSISDLLMLNTGISYEEGVTLEEYHEPGLAEAEQIEIGFGAQFPLTKELSLNASFFYQYFFDRTVTNSEQSPPTNGEYTDRRQYLNFNLCWSL
uniref:Long-chain fatty acid transport protein n=1 Tax=uncultured delta proteobacterium HF0010_08B07 TaxID=710821 RepID=E0XWW4_9DELT|nr:hypothetical protein [uncultured delta proteobacterium HF0010_08B07]